MSNASRQRRAVALEMTTGTGKPLEKESLEKALGTLDDAIAVRR